MKVVLVVDFEFYDADDERYPAELMLALRNRLLDHNFKDAHGRPLGEVARVPEFYS